MDKVKKAYIPKNKGVRCRLSELDVEIIKKYMEKYPNLGYRKILVMCKYVPREKIEEALFQINSFMTAEEYLNKFCGLNPSTIYKELYS